MYVCMCVCYRHEVADVAGLTSFSFGLEEEDRYVMLWKKVRKCSFHIFSGEALTVIYIFLRVKIQNRHKLCKILRLVKGL